MLPGVYQATKKDGTTYYRAGITFRCKHISLGSFPLEQEAGEAYCDAQHILNDGVTLEQAITRYHKKPYRLSFDKCVSLINFRDNNLYIANPIYMRKNFFSYYLSLDEELKFDIDDLFYYAGHKIMRRQGHLFVNDYGMQVTILSRYGIRSYAVCKRDYDFANNDPLDLRYSNIKIYNRFFGVQAYEKNGTKRYRVKIHLNGNYTVGTYQSEEKAAVAYNKAVDLAKKAGYARNFPENYVDTLSASEYAALYTRIKISQKYMDYLAKEVTPMRQTGVQQENPQNV